MHLEDTTNSVHIQIQSERQVDLLGYAGAAVSWIAPFQFNDGLDDFFGWPLRSRLPVATGREQQPVLSLLQCIVK